MDPLLLARLQFATTTSIHFLFVLVTLGLVTLLVYLQTAWVVTRKPVYERLTRFWGTFYLVNYALGITTGIVMEFQFGLNWSGLSQYAGNVFGAPLAIETLGAFFLESTLLGMWIFGWQRLRRGVHLALIYGVAITAYASAFWIMVANSWLQHPVGYEEAGGIAHLTDFGALLRNPAFGNAFGHVVSAALTCGGFLVAGISSWQLIRRTPDYEAFRRSLRIGVVTASVGVTLVMGFGFAQFGYLGRIQPTKFGDDGDKAAAAADFAARFGGSPADYLPPTWVGAPLGFMILIAFTLMWVWVLIPFFFRDWIIRLKAPLYLLLAATPLPFVAAIFGWLFREIGRQPWTVYGLLPTEDAVTQTSGAVLLTSFVGFTVLLLGLAVADWLLLARVAHRGTADPALGRRPDEPVPQPADRPDPVLA
ncbi:cytochrome ubiquinol oxidase subunit I [Phytohabitans sp. ZYX-F-186]|uniref:Cytochrome ubiquinol oxidase subunit I n=1 Tax=Phytohabitans maris TaxID=3071409 RepID=A0ABU0ZV30_9ACTN|nr:cytochrome ubiquinol oxidase subunit I [Phytohabitans sp. ZYX-F-186]MDQ7910040.1 cytochrome ubiquinol oxidase subunit I [Phytohabitans sp. ZYX-F-186]